MAVREVVEIDEELCDGCGDCVPCCRGLVQLAHAALAQASRTIPVRVAVVGIGGEVQSVGRS
jgi:ferredoxin